MMPCQSEAHPNLTSDGGLKKRQNRTVAAIPDSSDRGSRPKADSPAKNGCIRHYEAPSWFLSRRGLGGGSFHLRQLRCRFVAVFSHSSPRYVA